MHPDRYKWIALSNTTLGILMATINSSIILIALPNIFRGIGLNPLSSGNTSYLLWMLMGFMVATAVLLVSLGRVGDMFGRVKMYNLGFAVFTVFSLLLTITWMHGTNAALWLILMRVGQGVGGAFLFANSSAIIADAFPTNQRGLALGVNGVAAIAGSFIGLVLGGLLAPVEWRLVFLVSVPFGLFGTVWAYLKLEERSMKVPSRIDWWGNLTFAIGLIAVLVGITYGIEPYGGHTMGWTSPMVLSALFGGLALLVLFAVIEAHSDHPMMRLSLFKIRAFSAGSIATLLASLGRGGLMFILIIWLQGVWLPLHGYSFAQTPLWAGIYMLPLTVGFLIAGPISGILSDRHGARPFATGGMVIAALAFGLLETLPVNFSYVAFALLLLLMGLGMGVFSAPNQAGIMNSLPPEQRGSGAGIFTTFQNSAMVLSIGVFFTLIILGLAASLPHALYSGLVAQGVPTGLAHRVAGLPPVASLFAAFLGYNPMRTLLGPALPHLAHASYLTGRSFFPLLISKPFQSGLREAFTFAMGASLVAALASWMRGGKYVHGVSAPGDAALDPAASESALVGAGLAEDTGD
ncbi:MAG: transporter [Acidimicrobiaceae bacterium]|nr:transporter [Acidimicrobiaceae bacterium]